MADIFWSKLSSIQQEICLSITEDNCFQFKFTNCMLNHQSVTGSGVPPFIVFWYQKVEWITLNYSVVTKPMSYNSVLFPLTKLLVMVSYGWVLSWFLVYKVGWRILNDSFCLWILWHMLFWWGFVCISIYGITFGLNLQIFHIIWKSESLWLFSWPIMNTWTWVTSLVCFVLSGVEVPVLWLFRVAIYQQPSYIKKRQLYGDCDLSIVSYQNYCCA